jgi:hypothetical protein
MNTMRSASEALVLALAALKMTTTARHRLKRGSAEHARALETEARLNAEILDLAVRMDWSRLS